MVLYFAYGSNLLLSQIRERINNSNLNPSYIAFVPNSKLIFSRESIKQKGGVASYENCEGNRLWGAVFELTDDEKSKLDSKEGVKRLSAKEYEDTKIEVTKINETKIWVTTYVANKTGAYLPSQYYMDIIIRGAIDCSLPNYYIEELKHITTNGVQ